MGRRRYTPIGKFPAYDNLYGALKQKSPILNVTEYSLSEDSLKIGNAEGIKTLLVEREGSKNGEYFDPTFGGTWREAKLTSVNRQLEAIEEEFKKVKQTARNLGSRIPENMPPELFTRKLELEAKLDILLEECDTLRKLQNEFRGREEKEGNDRVLKYGPVGWGQGEPLRMLDGQNISANGEGELFIDDTRSPYNGMKVVDYRERIMMPFLTEQRKRKSPWLSPMTVKRENLPLWPEDLPRPAASVADSSLVEKDAIS